VEKDDTIVFFFANLQVKERISEGAGQEEQSHDDE
jgi:hypothetical protein